MEWCKKLGLKAYAEKNDLAAIHALLGLARRDLEGTQEPSIKRLLKVDFKKLDKISQLALLRTYAVIFSRGGKPSDAMAKAVGDQLDVFYPNKDDNLNEELARVLCYLQHVLVYPWGNQMQHMACASKELARKVVPYALPRW